MSTNAKKNKTEKQQLLAIAAWLKSTGQATQGCVLCGCGACGC